MSERHDFIRFGSSVGSRPSECAMMMMTMIINDYYDDFLRCNVDADDGADDYDQD